MFYYILKVLITAILVLLISEVAKKSTFLAGIVASIPITSFLAFIWIYYETNDLEKISDLSISILYMILPSLIFLIILPLVIKLTNSFPISLILASLTTLFSYWIYIIVLNKLNIHL